MKTLHNSLLIGLMILSMNINGQDLRILSTKDLVKISIEYGLDSAIRVTNGMPIYYLDRLSADILLDHTLKNIPSSNIENFLIDYSSHIKDNPKLPEILYHYFYKVVADSNHYKPDPWYWFNHVQDNSLIALIDNKTKDLESLLIAYYNGWYKKTIDFKSNYLEGIKLNESQKRDSLTSPFETANENCYLILLALRKIQSGFVNQEKLQVHFKYLKYYTSFTDLYFSPSIGEYDSKKNLDKSINLKKSYQTIGEIEFENEPELEKVMKGYNESYCWKFVIYNMTIGYMDLGCQSGPLAGVGVKYRLELKKNKLLFYQIITWIS